MSFVRTSCACVYTINDLRYQYPSHCPNPTLPSSCFLKYTFLFLYIIAANTRYCVRLAIFRITMCRPSPSLGKFFKSHRYGRARANECSTVCCVCCAYVCVLDKLLNAIQNCVTESLYSLCITTPVARVTKHEIRRVKCALLKIHLNSTTSTYVCICSSGMYNQYSRAVVSVGFDALRVTRFT